MRTASHAQLASSSPTDTSRLKTPSSAPVAGQRPFKAGPSVRFTSPASGRPRSATRKGRSAAGLTRRRPERSVGRRRRQHERRKSDRVGAAHPYGKGHLAGATIGFDVANVVDDQDRRGKEANRDREPERQGVKELLELYVGAVDGDQAEEEETKTSPSPA